jgi:hypothetical protein
MKNKPNVIIEFEGTAFEVDIETQSLIEIGHPDNSISFIEQMTDHGSHYDLIYDPKTRNAFDRGNDFDKSDDWTLVKIPKLIELNPQGMAERYNYPIDKLNGKTDFEVIVDQEAWALRRLGVLPRVDIAGEKFIVDLRLGELRHVKDHYPALRLKDFDFSGDGNDHVAFYHPATKQIVDLDPRLTEFPEGVVKIRFPGLIGLDPVGTARLYSIDERDLLRRYPIQKELKAEVIPLSETGVPAMIQRNREQLQRKHQENAGRLRPQKRPRF